MIWFAYLANLGYFPLSKFLKFTLFSRNPNHIFFLWKISITFLTLLDFLKNATNQNFLSLSPNSNMQQGLIKEHGLSRDYWKKWNINYQKVKYIIFHWFFSSDFWFSIYFFFHDFKIVLKVGAPNVSIFKIILSSP